MKLFCLQFTSIKKLWPKSCYKTVFTNKNPCGGSISVRRHKKAIACVSRIINVPSKQMERFSFPSRYTIKTKLNSLYIIHLLNMLLKNIYIRCTGTIIFLDRIPLALKHRNLRCKRRNISVSLYRSSLLGNRFLAFQNAEVKDIYSIRLMVSTTSTSGHT